MGQPTPPGDIPLYDGLGTEWNDVLSAVPEEARSTVGSAIKGRISDYDTRLNSYKNWDDVIKSGDPEHVKTALGVYNTIENKPQEVYELLGRHLGISTAEAKKVADAVESDESGDPRIEEMQRRIDTMTQILVGKHQEELRSVQLKEQEDALAKELSDLKTKHGEIDEEHILMLMSHNNVSAEDAYKQYEALVTKIRGNRPAPMVLGSSGGIPRQGVNPRTLDSKDTKNLVATLLQQSLQGR